MLIVMATPTERRRVAGPADAEEVAQLLDRCHVEFDEQTRGRTFSQTASETTSGAA